MLSEILLKCAPIVPPVVRPIQTELLSRSELALEPYPEQNFCRDLQQAAKTLSSEELHMYLGCRKAEFVARMNLQAKNSPEGKCVWELSGKTSPISSRMVLAFEDVDKSDFYIRERQICEGITKRVFLIIPSFLSVSGGRPFALAQFKEADSREMAEREVAIAHQLQKGPHSGIVEMDLVPYYRTTSPSRQLTALMEYCEGGTLSEYRTKETPLVERIDLSMDLLRHLICMHAAGICHLDLKPSNICITKKTGKVEPRIIDLNTAHHFDYQTDLCSTYPPPEMMHDKGVVKGYVEVEPSLDYWSIARILWGLLMEAQDQHVFPTLYLTYNDQEYDRHLTLVKEGISGCPRVNESFKQVLLQLLSSVPSERPCFHTVLRVLESLKEEVLMQLHDKDAIR